MIEPLRTGRPQSAHTSMHAYAALREKLDRGETVVLDGPVGSELVRRGVRWRSLGLRFDAPAVQAVHAEYLAAGADVLRTNTFQLNRRIYQDVFRDHAHMRHIGAPDLDCGDIPNRRFTVLQPDPHGFDDGGVVGVGCERDG